MKKISSNAGVSILLQQFSTDFMRFHALRQQQSDDCSSTVQTTEQLLHMVRIRLRTLRHLLGNVNISIIFPEQERETLGVFVSWNAVNLLWLYETLLYIKFHAEAQCCFSRQTSVIANCMQWVRLSPLFPLSVFFSLPPYGKWVSVIDFETFWSTLVVNFTPLYVCAREPPFSVHTGQCRMLRSPASKRPQKCTVSTLCHYNGF